MGGHGGRRQRQQHQQQEYHRRPYQEQTTGNYQKRQWDDVNDNDNDNDEEYVDDLAFAATFAIVPNNGTTLPASTVGVDANCMVTNNHSHVLAGIDDDDNEIEMEDDEVDLDDEENNDIDEDEQEHDKDEQEDVSDEDEEFSDEEVDNKEMSKEDLAKIVDDLEPKNDEEEEPIVTAPLTTENEVDGYKVPLQELESKLQFQLTVDEELTQSPSSAASKTVRKKKLDRKQLSLAGVIKNFMISDRTVVVESISVTPGAYAVGPLDEGSLLVIEVPSSLSMDESNDFKASSGTQFIPLGRIFEVFGPVSHPLYTIRLPSPPPPVSHQSSSRIQKPNPTQPENEIQSQKEDAENKEDKKVIETSNNVDVEVPTDTLPDNDLGPTPESLITAIGKEEVSSDIDKSQHHTEQTPDVPSNVSSEKFSGADTKKVVDHWSIKGSYAKYISQNSNIQVYYIQDEAKLIDTNLVLRASGKGCDASNLYDEEVVDTGEMYFSDDEAEREAKNKKKGGTRAKRNQNSNRQVQGKAHQQQRNLGRRPNHGATAPPGYHSSYPFQGRSHHGQMARLPQGFHHMQVPPPPPPVPSQSYPSHYAPPYFNGQSTPFPPPPPPSSQTYQYPPVQFRPSNARIQYSGPPPPPPINPDEPPAYQY